MDERRYSDFDLLIEPHGDTGYLARVLKAPAGEAGPLEINWPFAAFEVDYFLARIGRPRRGLTRSVTSPEAAAVREFGAKLFDAVFQGQIGVALANSLFQAEANGAGLRIRLRVADAPELADLPWEYLYDRSAGRFIALSEWTPLVRHLDLPDIGRPQAVDLPLRVLVLACSPEDYPPLDVPGETGRLRAALSDLESSGRVEIDVVEHGDYAALQRRLRRERYHVFHYIGHGGFDSSASDGVLVLEDRAHRGVLVSGSDIGLLLHDHRTLRMAILNSCEGARGDRSDPYAGTAQSLVRQGIPAVIAMQFEITDQAAITFSRSFYEAVADGYPLDASMAEARKAIRGESNPVEWGTPVLYLRAEDGRIFDVNDPSVALAQAAAAVLSGEGVQADIDPVPSVVGAPPSAPAVEAVSGSAPSTLVLNAVQQDSPSTGHSERIHHDPEYLDVLAGVEGKSWDAAEALLQSALIRFPDDPEITRRLRQILLRKQLAVLEKAVASGRGGWAAIATVLRDIVTIEPENAIVAGRLRSAEELSRLEDELRTAYGRSEWSRVVELGEQMGRIDSKSNDPDSLATQARAALERNDSPPHEDRHSVPAELRSKILGSANMERPPGLVTSAAVANQRFQQTRLWVGYDRTDVDELLRAVAATLRALEQSRAVEYLLRPEEVGKRRFHMTSIREGYDRSEVDAFLDRVESSLEYYRRLGRYESAP